MTDNEPDLTKTGPGCGGVALYILSGIIVLFTIGVIAVYVLVFINPSLPFNPFPPPTLPATAAIPTSTGTGVLVLPATWTPTSTPVASATREASATLLPGTLAPTQTPVVAVSATYTPQPSATSTAVPTATPSPTAIPYPLALQPGGIKVSQGFKGCSWTGIAGQVFGPNNGAPISNLIVHLEGTWNNLGFKTDKITGSATDYGPGGYEFVLGNQPVASAGTLWVQVVDAASMPLSDKVPLTTYGDCEHNLLIVNFSQVH